MRLTIEASAGTGKTYELTTIVAAAVAGTSVIDANARGSGLIDTEEFGRVMAGGVLAPSELVLVTFTENATRELHARVRARLAKLHQATATQNPDAAPQSQSATLQRPGTEQQSRGSSPQSQSAALQLPGVEQRGPGSAESSRLLNALGEIDTMAISTIHGFCARVIREHGFELGLAQGAMELIDEADLGRDLAMRWWSTRVRDDPQRVQWCADAGLGLKELIELANESIGSRGVELAIVQSEGADGLVAELMRFARAEVGEVLRARGAMTYQDQLVLVLEGVRHQPRLTEAIRARHRLAVIDEAQDTDPVQLEIFARLFDERDDPKRLLVLVGDPKQSIYSFRGADIDAYLRLRGSRAPLRLTTNRRSEAGVVEAVNRLFGGEKPFRRDGIEHPPVQFETTARYGVLGGVEPFEVAFGQVGESAEAWTTRQLHELLSRGLSIRNGSNERLLRWGDCAVLGRSNEKLQALDRALRVAGVPTILLGDSSVFASETVDDVRALLAACAEPGRPRFVRRAMISKLVGVGVARLADTDASALVAVWSARFAEWARASTRAGVLGIVENALHGAVADVEPRTATDALHLAELLHAEVGPGASAAALLTALDRLVSQHAETSTRPGDRMRRRIDRMNAVTLQTLHGSKGLEYGVVLLSWAGSPMLSARCANTLRVPSERVGEIGEGITSPTGVEPGISVLVPVPVRTRPAFGEQRECEEAIRLLYVGVTRARHAVRLFVEQSSRKSNESALASLGVTEEQNPWPPHRVSEREGNADSVRAIGSEQRPSLTPRGALSRASRDGPQSRSRPTARSSIDRALTLWVDTSFTRLTSSAHEDAPEMLATVTEPSERHDEPAPIVTRGALGGGKRLGRIMHQLFEWAALAGPGADVPALAVRAVAESGEGDGVDPSALAELATKTRSADLACVGGPSVTLGAIDPARVAVELSFCLPLGHRRVLTPAALADACSAAPVDSPLARFAPLAQRLRFGEIAGFLRGEIDLAFEHDGRWWIVDYKTNMLGERDEHYREPRLTDAMLRGHYVLQYALYAVALRRLLTLRGVNTSGAWLGGVIYPFVRGVDPKEPGRGLFIDAPPNEALDAIDALLIAPAPSEVRA